MAFKSESQPIPEVETELPTEVSSAHPETSKDSKASLDNWILKTKIDGQSTSEMATDSAEGSSVHPESSENKESQNPQIRINVLTDEEKLQFESNNVERYTVGSSCGRSLSRNNEVTDTEERGNNDGRVNEEREDDIWIIGEIMDMMPRIRRRRRVRKEFEE